MVKPTLQTFKSNIRGINLVHLISDNCACCLNYSSLNFRNYFITRLYILVGITP